MGAGNISWDDCRLFLALSSAGSFKKAAAELDLSINTVRNRIKRLEDVVQCALVHRTPKGVELTQIGRDLLNVAKEMASASVGARRVSARPHEEGSVVELHVTEGVGTFWMVPRLVDFRRQNPNINIRLTCSLQPVTHFESATTVALHMVRPEDPNAVCVHVGTLHLMPFASRAYLNANGVPASLQDARFHKIVLQSGGAVRDDIFPVLFGDDPPPGLIALETNSSSAHYWAVSRGLGLGMLPTYARAITNNVVPVDMELKLRRDLWLSYPIEAKNFSATRRVIDWVKRSFDNARYPWFGQDFIHPRDFETHFEPNNVVRLFSGFMEFGKTA